MRCLQVQETAKGKGRVASLGDDQETTTRSGNTREESPLVMRHKLSTKYLAIMNPVFERVVSPAYQQDHMMVP